MLNSIFNMSVPFVICNRTGELNLIVTEPQINRMLYSIITHEGKCKVERILNNNHMTLNNKNEANMNFSSIETSYNEIMSGRDFTQQNNNNL